MALSAIAAVVAVVVLAALAVLQVCVAAGAPWGRLVWGGRHRVLPLRLRVGSAVSVVLYTAMLWMLLARAGILPGGTNALVVIGSWVLFGYFTIGILMNALSRSRSERSVMTPVCTLLAVATLVIALS